MKNAAMCSQRTASVEFLLGISHYVSAHARGVPPAASAALWVQTSRADSGARLIFDKVIS